MSEKTAAVPVPRRQRGTDRDATPQPMTHARPSARRIARARLAVVLCASMWVLYCATVVVALSRGGALVDAAQLVTTVVFLISVTFLTLSACMHLLARSGALPRFAAHRRTRRIVLDEHFAEREPRLTALLPSRAEDPALVRMGLWSVALQEFPRIDVVLLLDDDPSPADDDARAGLEGCRRLTDDLAETLRPVFARVEAAAARVRDEAISPVEATEVAMREHAACAQWLRARAAEEPANTHVEVFFVEQILRRLADELDATATALLEAAEAGEPPLPVERARHLVERLVRIFGVRTRTFERRRYTNLSHTANKAMNLNAYLGLMGGRYRERVAVGGVALERVDEGHTDLEVPESDYVLTLDADSMLLPGYCLRLVHALEQPENAGVAVIQTPYSAYRGAPTRLERLAGATTDLQHIVHQGLTAFDATFWVGANAILRWDAIRQLRRESREDGIPIVRFISDRTAIEDTESSIDIAARGWSLLNYPERLSYSATPPDFGTLVIQRRRWADGGLLVLPKLHELAVRRRREGRPLRLAERLLRMNYLGSVSWVTLGLLAVLTLYPMDGQLVTVLLLLIAVPYFTEMASDLHALGYHRSDVAAIYGLNLLLLPVNLAGSAASLVQVLSGRRARFARTPKVSTRTRVPALYLIAPLVIAGIAAAVAVRSVFAQAWGTTVFAAFTALAIAWAIARLIGIRYTVSDLWFAWLDWIWVAPPAPAPTPDLARARWAAVLDDGPLESAGVAA
ncbi:glycosyltransferase, probably [Microbacterium testaceum StLB037]|uniref:Glycosyltransferase, probably n=1 Tax=Microbacterium testaceum (strain StLB037) TaxID=979556 RepID=E8NE24_MICTS|nr:glycosyltransferase family 2 protein [Microbacterium testaceum]BAJ75069.1 glycosyltransferase, probably [Microbacterium testaceum StLB037]